MRGMVGGGYSQWILGDDTISGDGQGWVDILRLSSVWCGFCCVGMVQKSFQNMVSGLIYTIYNNSQVLKIIKTCSHNAHYCNESFSFAPTMLPKSGLRSAAKASELCFMVFEIMSFLVGTHYWESCAPKGHWSSGELHLCIPRPRFLQA